jgi:hypothetical protein
MSFFQACFNQYHSHLCYVGALVRLFGKKSSLPTIKMCNYYCLLHFTTQPAVTSPGTRTKAHILHPV